jgi:hypothetical protein
MSLNVTREILRSLHITGGMIVLAYVYTPLAANPDFVASTRYVIVPGLTLTGIVMWQWPVLRGLWRRKD